MLAAHPYLGAVGDLLGLGREGYLGFLTCVTFWVKTALRLLSSRYRAWVPRSPLSAELDVVRQI